MIFELTMANLISLAGLFLAALWALLKVIGAQSERRLDERFSALSETRAKDHEALVERISRIETTAMNDALQWRRVEREFLRSQADLPLHYVRREDYVRGQSVIESKLDGLALRIENNNLKGGHGA